MRPSLKLVSIGLFALGIVLFALVFTSETKVVAAPPVAEPAENTVSNYVEKIQLENEKERDAQQEAYLHAKMAKAKKESVECQFWTQQQGAKPSKKNADKVTQFCELSADTSSASSTGEVQSAQKIQ
jgi:hypothetical protein